MTNRVGCGKFSIKSCYHKILENKNILNHDQIDWLWLWKLKVLAKISHFLWVLRQDKILSGEKCVTRGISNDDSYRMCGLMESSMHIFKNCFKANNVWQSLGVANRVDAGDLC